MSWDETYFCREVAKTNKLELLKWAREEKKCEWDEWTINAAACQGNLEMVKYCVANECPIDSGACAYAAKNGHLEVLKYLREEAKAPWDSELPLGRLKMVISTYSNILLSVSMINIRKCVYVGGQERPLGLFEVLTRNRQSAVGLFGRTRSARRTTTPSVYNTSSTTTVLSHPVGDTKMESCTCHQFHNNNRVSKVV